MERAHTNPVHRNPVHRNPVHRAEDGAGVTASSLFEPLRLPGGAVLGNRIAKAAMEESMSASGQVPDRRLVELYRRWAGAGRVC